MAEMGWESPFALTNGSGQATGCTNNQVEITFFTTVSLIPAAAIVLILSMFKKRKSYKPEWCFGRLGVVIPLNLLDEFEHRKAYAVAFGAITNSIFDILTGFDGTTKTSGSGGVQTIKVLVTFGRAFGVCANFFPFFACLYTEQVLLGSVMGTAYSLVWFLIKLYTVIDCPNPEPNIVPYIMVIAQTPTLICLGFLVLKYVWNIILLFRGQDKDNPLQRIEESVVFPFQLKYVKSLLRKPPPDVDWEAEGLTVMQKLKAYYKKFYFDDRCHFKYSTRIFCTIMIIFMGSYQMAVSQMYYSVVGRQTIREVAVTIINATNIISENSTQTVEQNVNAISTILWASWIISSVVAFSIAIFGLMGTLSNYRTHLLSLYRGDRSFCSKGYEQQSANSVSNSMKYAGFQIAYSIWGNIIHVLALLAATLVFSFIIILPIVNGSWAVVFWLFNTFGIPLVVSTIIRVIQGLLAKRCFLQQKMSDDDDDQPLAIDNRRLYHVADYFFFVANVAVGLFSCLLRIVKGAGVGLFYLSRLDKCVLMSGWESMDAGFMSYVGMLALESAHNHPAMRVFCHVMLETQLGRQSNDTQGTSETKTSPDEEAGVDLAVKCHSDKPDTSQIDLPQLGHGEGKTNPSFSQKENDLTEDTSFIRSQSLTRPATTRRLARARWYLVYTMLRNPDVIPLRHHTATCDTSKEWEDSPLWEDDVYVKLKATVAAMEMKQEIRRKDAKAVDTDPAELTQVSTDVDTDVTKVELTQISTDVDTDLAKGEAIQSTTDNLGTTRESLNLNVRIGSVRV